MIYSVTITSYDGENIVIGKDGVEEEKDLITDVIIHMDTIDNDAHQKSLAMLAKIVIKGKIDSTIKTEVINLFNWAKSLDKSRWYRTITIKAKEDMDNDFRTYVFDKVFVVDYMEFYKTESVQNDSTNVDRDHFELYLTQKEGNLMTIETYAAN